MKRFTALVLLPFILSACGSGDEKGNTISLDMGEIENGVAELTVSITDSNDDPITEGEVSITPVMNMDSGMTHSTPVANQIGQLNNNGQMTATAYFLMPSMNGTWHVDVLFNDINTTFDINVDMMMSDRKVLKGNSSDLIQHMESEVPRSYYLFNLGRMVNSTHNQFTTYVAARETLMEYQAITDGVVLNANTQYEYTLGTVVVEMCSAACDNEANWKTAVENSDAAGEYTATELNLTGDENDIIEVRLSIGGETKTSDGSETGNNASFSFANASTSSPMSMM
ncbi:hypothetical protein NBRC116188_07950 [Oceaniserpentilla sp. 4NH20-0058]|uniref:hypothetical protein n=1 Tax=Oceaniserpentilla sp. 4NH20-0058 TaxID=3127660 RepID=UPI003102F0E4